MPTNIRQWSAGRNASNNNSLIADPIKFPRGMAAVGDDLHALGLGFGMYSDAGTYTCGELFYLISGNTPMTDDGGRWLCRFFRS